MMMVPFLHTEFNEIRKADAIPNFVESIWGAANRLPESPYVNTMRGETQAYLPRNHLVERVVWTLLIRFYQTHTVSKI